VQRACQWRQATLRHLGEVERPRRGRLRFVHAFPQASPRWDYGSRADQQTAPDPRPPHLAPYPFPYPLPCHLPRHTHATSGAVLLLRPPGNHRLYFLNARLFPFCRKSSKIFSRAHIRFRLPPQSGLPAAHFCFDRTLLSAKFMNRSQS
jgi:hypothetical protein